MLNFGEGGKKLTIFINLLTNIFIRNNNLILGNVKFLNLWV